MTTLKTSIYVSFLLLSLIIKICIFCYFQNKDLFDNFQELISSLIIISLFCNSYIIISIIIYWVVRSNYDNNVITHLNHIICVLINALQEILIMTTILLLNQHFFDITIIEFQLINIYFGFEMIVNIYIIYTDTYNICYNTSENIYFNNNIINYGTDSL